MSDNNINHIAIPKYSKRQDFLNVLTHIIGCVLSLIILITLIALMIIKKHNDLVDYIAVVLYGLALIAQFSISSIYHADKSHDKKKQIKRLLDHLTIFILIAGTYLPVCLIGLKNTTEGLAILISILVLASLGIILNIWHMDKLPVRVVTLIFYVLMGWMIIYVPSAFHKLPYNSFLFMLLGGVTFTIGAILYAIGHLKSQWFHVIFHILIVIGAILQAVGVFYLI